MVQFTTVLATLAPILTLTAGLALPDPRNITSASFADLDKRADTGVYMCQNQNWKGPCFWQDNPGQNTCVMLNKPWAQNIWSFGPDRGWKQCTVYMGAQCNHGGMTVKFPGQNLLWGWNGIKSYRCIH